MRNKEKTIYYFRVLNHFEISKLEYLLLGFLRLIRGIDENQNTTQ
jgi:hypothetical protein